MADESQWKRDNIGNPCRRRGSTDHQVKPDGDAYRQPIAGATYLRIASMTWAL